MSTLTFPVVGVINNPFDAALTDTESTGVESTPVKVIVLPD